VKVLGIVLSLMMVGAQAAPTCDPTMSSMRFSPSWWQRTDAGWYAFVACRNPDTGLFDFYGAACRHGVCNQTDWWTAMADYGTAIGDTAKKASFGTSWMKIMTNDCSAPSSLDEAICTAFTINAPTNGLDGMQLTITLRNASGGALGVATWNAAFKMSAWTNPANGQSRSITFRYDSTNWVQVGQTGVDVPN
jgi:hypothetical protein